MVVMPHSIGLTIHVYRITYLAYVRIDAHAKHINPIDVMFKFCTK